MRNLYSPTGRQSSRCIELISPFFLPFRVCTKSRCERPPAAFGRSPPHEGENSVVSPSVRGTARAALTASAGGSLTPTFCAKYARTQNSVLNGYESSWSGHDVVVALNHFGFEGRDEIRHGIKKSFQLRKTWTDERYRAEFAAFGFDY